MLNQNEQKALSDDVLEQAAGGAVPGLAMQKKTYRLSFDGQVNASLNNEFPYYIFEMKEAVEAGKLQEAVVSALKYHPTFQTRLIKKRFQYYLEENEKLPIVREAAWDEPIVYGQEDTNDYPWIITCYENKIVFACAHMLCDGMGAMHFLKDVLNCYFGLKVAEQERDKTIEDSFAIHANKAAKAPFKRKKQEPAAAIPLSMFDTEVEKCKLYRFVISKASVKGLAASADTSAFAMLSGMAAKALSRVLNIESGNINILIATDLRRQYRSITDRGFILTPELTYNVKKLKKKDMFLTATALRSQLDLYMDQDNLDYEVLKAQRNNDLLKICPFILKIAQKAFYKMLYAPSANIVYTHLMHMGLTAQLEEKIRDFYIGGTKSASPLLVVMGSNFGDKISLTFVESTKDKAYSMEFARVLKEEGIDYQMEQIVPRAPLKHQPDRL